MASENHKQPTPPYPEPYVFVKEMSSFPGGTEALLRYISENIVYPEEVLTNQIQGTVFLRFVVGSTGEVSRIEVTRSADPLLDDEAVRVVSTLPRWKPGKQDGNPASRMEARQAGWKPGKQDGNPVPVWFSLPVTFRLE